MSYVLIVFCSQRKRGNTSFLVNSLKKGIINAKDSCEIIYLNNFRLNTCLGCNKCHEPPYKCVQKDSWSEIYSEFDKADVIVFASPVYFYSFSAQMKIFIDRLYPYFSNHNIKRPQKKSFLLMTAADEDASVFRYATEYYENVIVRNLGFDDLGKLLVGGLPMQTSNKPKLMAASKKAETIGMELTSVHTENYVDGA